MHPSIGRYRALHIEGRTHLREHVSAVRDLVVNAEARMHSVVERCLKGRDAFTETVLRIGTGAYVDCRTRRFHALPYKIRPALTVVERVVRSQQIVVPELLEFIACGVLFCRNSDAHPPGQRPMLAVHACEHAERHQLIARAEESLLKTLEVPRPLHVPVACLRRA